MSRPVHSVLFYFDFISPYSWLALLQAPAFAAEHGVAWNLRPVVYAKLLDATGLRGPAETPAKRRYMVHDVARCANRLGATFCGPPAHPFRSLEALRCACLFRDDARLLDLCVDLADAAWGRGRDLTDTVTLQDLVRSRGLPAADLLKRISAPEIKEHLAGTTREALDAGVFGVPTFIHAGDLFWGHDRMSHLAERLRGRLEDVSGPVERMLARPAAAVRPASRHNRG